MAFVPLNSAEEDNETSWYKAAAAGIVSGIIKIPEGIVSLGAELIDLGAGTDTAASVEQFFDKLNPFEEVAEERGIGKLTEAIMQIGVPGTIGLKAASTAARKMTAKTLKAKRTGAYAEFGKGSKFYKADNPLTKGTSKGVPISKSYNRDNLSRALKDVTKLNKGLKIPRYAAGVFGGAAGEVLVGDVEGIGTFGDMFDGGPTKLDREKGVGRDEAGRRIINRLKFGSESLLITPFVYGAGRGLKELANRGKDAAYSKSAIIRALDKYVRAPFVPEGNLGKEIFDSENMKEALKATDIGRAKQIVDNLTREVDAIFPDIKVAFDAGLKNEKTEFMRKLDDILFEGELGQVIDRKKIDDLLETMKKGNVKEDSRQAIIGGLNNARTEFVELMGMLDKSLVGKVTPKGKTLSKGQTELKGLLSKRVNNWVGGSYKMFEEPKGLFKFMKRYKPTQEANDNAVRFFREQIAKENGDKTFDIASNKYTFEAQEIVDKFIKEGAKRKKPAPLALKEFVNKTMEGKSGAEFIKQSMEVGNIPPKEIRELMGEIKDPRYSIYNAMTSLSSVTRTAAYLKDVSAKNDAVQLGGQRGFFWPTKNAAENAVDFKNTGIELVAIDDIIKQMPGAGKIANPLAGKYTTKEIAEAIGNANGIDTWLQGFVRGEGKEGAEAAASWFYRNLLLFPKGISQMSKTIFSAPTHIRNFLSAFGFAGANGNLFEPEFYTKAFGEGVDVAGLAKLGPTSPKMQTAYRELQEFGLVNQQIQVGDMKGMFEQIQTLGISPNVDGVLGAMMKKLKKVGQFAQGKYIQEDDTIKVASYITEMGKLKRGYAKAGMQVPEDILKFVPEEQLLKKYDDLMEAGYNKTYSEFKQTESLKRMAVEIVKNTVPNYAYVGSAVKTARLLPIGNFMSFPSEMIRTTTNIAELGINQLKHSGKTKGSNILPMVFDIEANAFVKNDNPFYGDGMKRLLGLATFTTAAPIAITEGAKALYDVTQDELDALRRFVPDWSKNSTLIPVRDDEGELRYIDFSGSNAYDVVAKPLRTVINNIQDGKMTDQGLLESFVTGVNEAGAQLLNPFISESIWIEAANDLVVRGGRTDDGRLLYTDQTSAGDKAAIRFQHLGKALLPSINPYRRLFQAATDTPTKSGQELDIGSELAGFMGMRPIKVDPLRTMNFKIANYQSGIRNARKEFTGGFFGLLKGGPVEEEDVIKRFIASNKARFGVQQEMFRDLNAAEELGVERYELNNSFKERQLSDESFYSLINSRFTPYFPSEDIENKFREIANNLDIENPYLSAKNDLNSIRAQLRQLGFDQKFRNDFAVGGHVESTAFTESITGIVPILERLDDAMSNMNLEESFDEQVDLSDYIDTSEKMPTPPLPNTPMPNQNVIQASIADQATEPLNQGLTNTENALLSQEEKMIRLRQRGLA